MLNLNKMMELMALEGWTSTTVNGRLWASKSPDKTFSINSFGEFRGQGMEPEDRNSIINIVNQCVERQS